MRPFRQFETAFLRPYRGTVLLALVGLMVQAVLALPLPIVQGRVLDALLSGHALTDVREPLATAFFTTVVCLAGRAWLAWRVGITMTRVSLEVAKNLTDSLHRKLRRLPLSFLDRHQTGGLMARLTGDVGTLMIFLNTGTLQLVSDLILAGGIAILLALLNLELTAVALAAVPLAACGHRWFSGRLNRRAEEARAAMVDLYSLLGERVPALRVTRAFNQESAELARLDACLDCHATASRRVLATGAGQAAVALLAGSLGSAGVVVGGAWLIAQGRLSPGELIAFYALTAMLYAPIVRLAQFQSGMEATRVAFSRMLELFDEPSPADGLLPMPRETVRGGVVLKNLTFHYRDDGPRILSDINLCVLPGLTLGVIGPSGSGKSTLLSLVARLYDPVPGSVFVDGQDITEWKSDDLRMAVMLVPQRPVLFEGTIRSNLAYAAPDATDSRLWTVLEAVDLAGLIRARPLGLDAPLGPGGSGLSGGQRQRLALARAVLTNPAVLLLDDSTSALDTETEVKVYSNLRRLTPSSTWIVVSHKTNVVRCSAHYVVLERGAIVDSSSHQGLESMDDGITPRFCRFAYSESQASQARSNS